MISSSAIAAIVDRRRALVVLALEVEGVLVEALEQELELLLEQFAIGLGVEQRRAERFHLAGVIAAADTHDNAPVGHDVGHRIVLGEPDRVPHRQDVEGAAELEPLGLGGEPQSELDQVRQDLVALALEMVLGRPQHVVAELVHELRDVARGRERLPQPLVGIAPVVGRRAGKPDIVELDLADIEDVEVLDHRAVPRIARTFAGTLCRLHPSSQPLSQHYVCELRRALRDSIASARHSASSRPKRFPVPPESSNPAT